MAKTTIKNITDEQLRVLRDKSNRIGDVATADLASNALTRSHVLMGPRWEEALAKCADIIAKSEQ